MRSLIPLESKAKCADPSVEPDWWFEESDPALAKAICDTCPLKVRCLEYAVTNNEHHGVWGGLTVEERQQRKRKAAKK
jgi:WhiB family redox-sensing transcriptional regulator